MNMATELASLFERDLGKLIQQIEGFADDETLWRTLPGVTNSAGNLALHLEGNLREFIGRQLGKLPYSRKRDLEFSSKGMQREELVDRIKDVQRTIPGVIAELSAEQMDMEYPEVVLGAPISTRKFLFHLYGHMNWHVGQINYLRRILAGDESVKQAGV
jgi:Protein of unknown function (DUF664)